ncbi:MAG: SDR family NAD(P)-dependent oxidoreductase [Chloroflexi bacterium]|nr:SDR family NAD(P)-dependent oxidoreductase [Chloroflexota bacterium]
MSNRLKEKVAVVTGGGRGIGRAEAVALAAEGAKVVVNDLGVEGDGTGASNSRPADEVVAKIMKMDGEAVANYDSVATPEGADRIIKTAIESFGRLDILVNNAGIVRYNFVWDMTDDELDAVIKTNLYGTMYTSRAACRIFREQKSGRIINTSSGSGHGLAKRASYSAAKEAIIGFTKTVSLDMSQYGATCNAIRPVAATRLTTRMPQFLDQIKQLRAAGDPQSIATAERFQQVQEMPPEDIAPLVVYLATDEASYITGCVFEVFSGTVVLQAGPIRFKTISTDGRWTVDRLAKFCPGTIGQDIEAVRRLSGGLG